MDKGIRPFCNAKFMELLPQRQVLGNAGFRKAVRESLIENFDCTEASASTHYNHSFQEVKKTNPELVEGLGRPEDKKGGRKKKVAEDVVHAPFETVEQYKARMVLELASKEQTEFCVKKKSDGSIVAQGLSLEDARALCEKAKAAKKAALYWI